MDWSEEERVLFEELGEFYYSEDVEKEDVYDYDEHNDVFLDEDVELDPALRAVAPESIDLEQICATYADCKSCPLLKSKICWGNYHGDRYKGFRRSKRLIEEVLAEEVDY